MFIRYDKCSLVGKILHIKSLLFNRIPTLLISIGKLKHTIGIITYRYSCALDSKGKTAFKSFYL